jgi:lipopolysaccharide biosynthesis regulator YciM
MRVYTLLKPFFYTIILLALTASSTPSMRHDNRSFPQLQVDIPKTMSPLLQLMLAETAKYTDPKQAAEFFLAAAISSQQTNVAMLATEYALLAKEKSIAKTAAKLAASLAPSKIETLLPALALHLSSQPALAQDYLQLALQLAETHSEYIQDLVMLFQKLSMPHRYAFQQLLLQALQDNPNSVARNTCYAYLQALQHHYDTATKYTDTSLQLRPDYLAAIQLKATLLYEHSKTPATALAFLAKQQAKYPKNYPLLLLYIYGLLEHQQVASATTRLQTTLPKLPAKHPLLPAFTLALSEAYILQHQWQAAKKLLLPLTNHALYQAPASYFLGTIAEQQTKLAEAIAWYSNVESGEFHIPATLQAVNLLMEQAPLEALRLIQEANPSNLNEQKELLLTEVEVLVKLQLTSQALALINHALQVLPSDTEFLRAQQLLEKLIETKK